MTTQQLHTTRQAIGQRLADIRDARGLTQQQVADLTGIKRPHIARAESGKYNFGIDILAKIASALNCDIDFKEL